MIITPPRLNGLRIKRQSFGYFIEQFKWNYILEDDPDGHLKDEDDGEDTRTTVMLTTETMPPAHQQQAIKSADTMQ